MATGSGKTAIYALAGLLLAGPVVVVSPLIALQRDQVEAIPGDQAVMLNSAMGESARDDALAQVEAGEARFLLLAPEQLGKPDVVEQLRQVSPALFVVDEAHCVSEWGHDFRPDYLKLASAIAGVGRPRVLALTATAATPVRDDIITLLGLDDPRVIVRGFDRPNIHLAVERFHNEDHKARALVEAVVAAEPPGIVYAATHRASEELSLRLREAGVRACSYHAGMTDKRRREVQDAFMNDAGCDVVVATVAFGMGVDKSNVRWVFHEQGSDSVDSYYQEIGRAGRDGDAAAARLFYRPEDLGLRRFFSGATIDPGTIEQVGRVLVDRRRPLDPGDLLDEADVPRTRLQAIVHRLEDVGAVEVDPDGRITATTGHDDLPAAVAAAAREEHEHHAFERSRVEMMRAYAERRGCRRAFILGYFGEEFSPPCGNCDNCDRGLPEETQRAGAPALPYGTGDRVSHRQWSRNRLAARGRPADGRVRLRRLPNPGRGPGCRARSAQAGLAWRGRGQTLGSAPGAGWPASRVIPLAAREPTPAGRRHTMGAPATRAPTPAPGRWRARPPSPYHRSPGSLPPRGRRWLPCEAGSAAAWGC
ncbi:MAG: RecQ family ATP-dependent DNA helicase [Solirubrobacteraceae bacterium]